ncbi:hypothetical protein LZC95_48640 [Pendulispora brunnea]|uniref:Uncharacterized protein n=1 Tax=Pendulispora brunnea TaxID=2905690 RepID=A0ABZ2K6I4_9BACT
MESHDAYRGDIHAALAEIDALTRQVDALTRQNERLVSRWWRTMVVASPAIALAGWLTSACIAELRRPIFGHTRSSAHTVRQAAQLFRVSTNSTACPSIFDLQRERQLEPSSRVADEWNNPFLIECADDETVVRSAGPDRIWNTADDIRVPAFK